VRFVDLFAGLGGFHVALHRLGFECVFASEVDPELRDLYRKNYPTLSPSQIVGDIRFDEHQARIPRHEILCAGFPCQPFSKSGSQKGFLDVTRGTLFHEILKIAAKHKPDLILLENVGNFARHDGGNTWNVVRRSLEELGYDVRGTSPKVAGGHGLISPHHFGLPHHRERFFIVAASWDLPRDPFPARNGYRNQTLGQVLLDESRLTEQERRETRLNAAHVDVIEHWNRFLRQVPKSVKLPSFPLWADEFAASYPFEEAAPASLAVATLAQAMGLNGSCTKEELLLRLPPYARSINGVDDFPEWKKRFIRQNREWFRGIAGCISPQWLQHTEGLVPSHRKFEWNCGEDERNVWSHILQFRPSGLRVKRFDAIPALVAMTTTQIPILGPRRRFLSRREGLRLQGFDSRTLLPRGHGNAFRALGNAVHVGVVERLASSAYATLGALGPTGGAT
jgi:DNA (cytosine-5)-methyltransferase 1